MKIRAIETIPVRLAINPMLAIRARAGLHFDSTFVLVKVHTDEGITGLGEVSATPRWSGEDHATAVRLISEYFAPALTGEDPTSIDRAVARMHAVAVGNPFTKAGIEMALWDIAGKAAGVPVYKLFGGPVRDSVTTKWSVSGLAPDRAASIAEWALGRGFRAMKVKVGIDRAEDIERVRAVRGVVGAGFKLGADANGAWRPAVAIDMVRRLTAFDIAFAEQPVPPGDVNWLADVRRNVTVPVMADESVFSPQEAISIIRASAADVLSVYVGKAGGIAAARQIALIAEAAGLTCTIGSNLEMGIATAAMIHLGMSTTGIGAEEFPCDIIGPLYYEDGILAEPLDLADGRAVAPARPGLGVDLDEARVARYRVQ
ncbi:MAG: mandelate racemase/muconate lactonizing protein [Acidobacteria bacterium]|nr:mandelate racemase/muconate lactonizing protein [Acidobacteriota bacterium]